MLAFVFVCGGDTASPSGTFEALSQLQLLEFYAIISLLRKRRAAQPFFHAPEARVDSISDLNHGVKSSNHDWGNTVLRRTVYLNASTVKQAVTSEYLSTPSHKTASPGRPESIRDICLALWSQPFNCKARSRARPCLALEYLKNYLMQSVGVVFWAVGADAVVADSFG